MRMPLSVVVKCFKVMTIASLIIDDILRKMPDLLFPKGGKKKNPENQSRPITTCPLVTFPPEDCVCVLLINTAWKMMNLSAVTLR